MSNQKTIRVNKKSEHKLAYFYYVELGKTIALTAEFVKVSELTVSKWVAKGNWKEIRNSKQLATEMQEHNIKNILNDLVEERIEMGRLLKQTEDPKEKKAIRMSMASLADEASKFNKVLDKIKTDNKISLKVYLEVAKSIFDDLGAKHPQLYAELIKADFESNHILKMAEKLG